MRTPFVNFEIGRVEERLLLLTVLGSQLGPGPELRRPRAAEPRIAAQAKKGGAMPLRIPVVTQHQFPFTLHTSGLYERGR